MQAWGDSASAARGVCWAQVSREEAMGSLVSPEAFLREAASGY